MDFDTVNPHTRHMVCPVLRLLIVTREHRDGGRGWWTGGWMARASGHRISPWCSCVLAMGRSAAVTDQPIMML